MRKPRIELAREDSPLPGKRTPLRITEIVRSFSYKMNAGNYESRDFFCSAKADCREVDLDETSDAVYQWCKRQVLNAVHEWREERMGETETKPPQAVRRAG